MASKNLLSRDILVELVKAAGQELIDKAETMLSEDDYRTDMDIWIRFRNDEPPKIECSSTAISRNSYQVLANHFS